MEIKHTLIKVTTRYEVVEKRIYLDSFHFTYQLSGNSLYPNSTFYVLDEVNTNGNPMLMITYPQADYDNNARNISQGEHIPAGTYSARIKNPNGYIRIYRVPTIYTPYEIAELVGEFYDGDVITLEGDNEIYFIADNDKESVENLDNYLTAYKDTKEYIPVKEFDTTEVQEPIGFDSLQMTMKRHDYHGMGAEVSLDNLEFYGEACHIIKTAYAADIDSEVRYEVLADSDTLYSGVLDLSTYSLKQGDYDSVSVKVGEIGVKTTFNNRLDTAIDVSSPKTVDGDPVEAPTWLNLHIPLKHLLYTNYSKQTTKNTIGEDRGTAIDYPNQGVRFSNDEVLGTFQYIYIPIGNIEKATEYGTFENQNYAFSTNDINSIPAIYTPATDHSTQYGDNTKTNIEINLKSTIIVQTASFAYKWYGNMYYRLIAKDSSGNTIIGETNNWNARRYISNGYITQGTEIRMSCTLRGELNADDEVRFCIEFWYDQINKGYMKMIATVRIEEGSYVKMTMYDNLTEDTPVNADMLLVHDALNVVSHAISENELSVKSEWYCTPESKWEAGMLGGGALKALTNGYKIRGLFTDGETERNMPLSFKNLIESLNAQDCIGWGFAQENGTLCVRVERWDWYYKDDVILTLDNVAEVQTDIDADRIITELEIGYKKYATNEQYNSIDSPHGSRTFNNSIKAVSNTINAECEFIADNYAIEETRRANLQKSETEESTYDENIFIFELVRKVSNEITTYEIGHTSTSAVGVGASDEFINAKLTPRQMAERWKDYLFATNSKAPLLFKKGEINYLASFGVMPESYTEDDVIIQSLRPFNVNEVQKENDDIAYVHSFIKAETIKFSYPLKVSQYKAVKANPYGLIRVNGQYGWIREFKYSFVDGLAEFTLIAKY